MAYMIRYRMDVVWVADGAGPMTGSSQNGPGLAGPGSAQVLSLFQASPVLVPGGDAPSQANFNTAIGTTMTADLEAQIAANLSRVQAFATGGG